MEYANPAFCSLLGCKEENLRSNSGLTYRIRAAGSPG
ncbi:hypothetical protein [Desulforudis sp. DRI-14]